MMLFYNSSVGLKPFALQLSLVLLSRTMIEASAKSYRASVSLFENVLVRVYINEKYISFDQNVLAPSAPHLLSVHPMVDPFSVSVILLEVTLIILSICQEENASTAFEVSVELP
jgi:hypothetical protein